MEPRVPEGVSISGKSAAGAAAADASVRPARAGDSLPVAEIQVHTWLTCYAPHLPPGALDALDVTLVEAGWRAAISSPPSPAHRLLVALRGGLIVGYLAAGPGEDEDASAADGEILALTVTPAEQRMGHGSRLLAAGIQALLDTGFGLARTWTFDADVPLHTFLSAAGWEPDGARRELDMGEPVGQQRWHVTLTD
jgi:GNAT superfamily N-acetyltransferase